MDELYKLCEATNTLKFDYSEVLERDKADVSDWIHEIYYNYENELANARTLYAFVLDVQTVVSRIGYKLNYQLLEDGELFIKIVGGKLWINQL